MIVDPRICNTPPTPDFGQRTVVGSNHTGIPEAVPTHNAGFYTTLANAESKWSNFPYPDSMPSSESARCLLRFD
jgi:hypothetical protein